MVQYWILTGTLPEAHMKHLIHQPVCQGLGVHT